MKSGPGSALPVRIGSWEELRVAATAVRTTVFVGEQGIPADLELDDRDPVCVHAVAYSDAGDPIATGRLLPDGHIGRMAVLASERGKGIGSRILGALVRIAAARGMRTVRLHAQTSAVGFYERAGFVAVGEEYEEAGIPHQSMERTLAGPLCIALCVIALALALSTSSTSARAESSDRKTQWQLCAAHLDPASTISAKQKIQACNSRIQSGEETPRNIALAYVNLSEAHATEKDAAVVLRDLDLAVEAAPNLGYARAHLCQAHWHRNHDRKIAVDECSVAIEREPTLAYGWFARGDIYFDLASYDQAIDDYGHAIGISPWWTLPRVKRGEAYLRGKNYDHAIEDFDGVIEKAPAREREAAYVDRGAVHMLQSQPNLALMDFDAALQTNPKSAYALYGRGLAKNLRGDRNSGNPDMEAAQAVEPKVADWFREDGITSTALADGTNKSN